MAELFASIEGGAIVERLPSAATPRRSSTAAREEDPGVKPGRARKGIINKQTKELCRPGSGPTARTEKNSSTPELERQLPAADEAIDEYRVKALELMNANVNATLEYAWRLASVRSPAEIIELSTNHACRHFKLIMMLRLHLARCGGF